MLLTGCRLVKLLDSLSYISKHVRSLCPSFPVHALSCPLPQPHFSTSIQGLSSSTPTPHPQRSTAPVRPLHVHYTTCSILETLVHSSPRPTMRLLIAAVVVLSAARSALGSAYVGCFPSSDVTGFTPPTSGLTQPSNGACIVSEADPV